MERKEWLWLVVYIVVMDGWGVSWRACLERVIGARPSQVSVNQDNLCQQSRWDYL